MDSCLSEEILEVFNTLGASAFSKRKNMRRLKSGAVPSSRVKIDFNYGSESFLANSQDVADKNLESNEMIVEFVDGDDYFAKRFQLTYTGKFLENDHQNK